MPPTKWKDIVQYSHRINSPNTPTVVSSPVAHQNQNQTISTTAAKPAITPIPPLTFPALLCVGAAVLLDPLAAVPDVLVLGETELPLEAPEVVVAAAAEEVVVAAAAELAVEADVLVTSVAGVVVTVAVSLVTVLVAFVIAEPTLVLARASTEATEAEDLEMAEAATEVALEATDARLWTDEEREASGATGTGMFVMTCPIVEVVMAGFSVMTAEPVPATLDATTASSEAADAAFIDAALAADAGVGAATTAGAIVTVPVGIEAVAGSWSDVVKPFTAMGTTGPGDSVEGATSAPDGMAETMDSTTGTGPVTVKMRVSILMLVVAGRVTVDPYTVVVIVGATGITMLWGVPLTVKK